MGSAFNQMTIAGDKTRDEVKALFGQAQQRDRYENGHSYSGGFGMAHGLHFEPKTFDSDMEAADWIADHSDKYGPAVAVTFKGKDGKAEWMIGAWCSE